MRKTRVITYLGSRQGYLAYGKQDWKGVSFLMTIPLSFLFWNYISVLLIQHFNKLILKKIIES